MMPGIAAAPGPTGKGAIWRTGKVPPRPATTDYRTFAGMNLGQTRRTGLSKLTAETAELPPRTLPASPFARLPGGWSPRGGGA